LINDGNIENNWIHSTDADVSLPSSYFQQPAANPIGAPQKCAAMLYPFEHHCLDNALQPLIDLYEFKLRYYVAALRWSGSEYAFHTIGSLICVDANSYAQVRGFPKRSAAEDFYLLNKLAKVGSIRSLTAPKISIEARLSERVPFGTGPALNSIKNMDQPLRDYRFYHPQSFNDLAVWLNLITPLWHARERYQQLGFNQTIDFLLSENKTESEIDDQQAKRLSRVLASQKIESFLQHGFKQCRSEAAFRKQMHDWFDGFKTLRFIHLMREYYFDDVALQELTKNHTKWLTELSLESDNNPLFQANIK